MSRDRIVLAEHDARWVSAFGLVDAAVRASAPALTELHHVGSTAIPGIRAKPILDVLAVADTLAALDECRAGLEAAGFVWKGEYGIPGRRYCVLYDSAEEKGLVHLHAFARGHEDVRRHLRFRDRLRADPTAALEYETLKSRLAAEYGGARELYTNGKADFIRRVSGQSD